MVSIRATAAPPRGCSSCTVGLSRPAPSPCTQGRPPLAPFLLGNTSSTGLSNRGAGPGLVKLRGRGARDKGPVQMHDQHYRRLFAFPRLVEDLLRGFVGGDWLEDVDFSTLGKLSADYVSEERRARRGDTVWRVRRRDAWLHVLVLLEFRSTDDPDMALRILEYTALDQRQLFCRRIAAPDLLPGEHRCLRIPVTEGSVQRQLLLPLVLPHLRMLPAILRMIVPAVSGESRARGAPGQERAARWFTLDRRSHGMGGVSALDAALDARLPPVGHLTMHHQTAPVHPHVVRQVVARADRSGCSPVRYVTVCNRLVVLTNTEAEGGLPGSGGRTTGSVAGRVARRFTLERSTPRHAACSGAGSALALVSVERHDRPPVPWLGGHRLRAATPVHRLVADVDADFNRLPSGAPSGIRRSAASRGRRGRPGRPVQAGPQGP